MLDSLSALKSVLSTPVQQKAPASGTSPAFMGSTLESKTEPAVPSDFTDMLTQLFNQTADSLKKAEAASTGALQGTVSMQEAVQTVMVADQSLQTAIAIRDKITAAYLEFSRMAI